MKSVSITYVPQTGSTNDLARSLPQPSAWDDVSCVCAGFQTRGRGESGGWESERDKNLLFTLVLSPEFLLPRDGFLLSAALSLALCDALASCGAEVRVKWPNDVYAGDRKLCGILIEHDVAGGKLARTLLGVGVNVNQRAFFSSAPNPISLVHLLGREIAPRTWLERTFLPRFMDRYAQLREETLSRKSGAAVPSSLLDAYVERLYWRDGQPHPFVSDKEPFMAKVDTALPDGRLRLLVKDGNETTERVRLYAFKQVRHLLPSTLPPLPVL